MLSPGGFGGEEQPRKVAGLRRKEGARGGEASGRRKARMQEKQSGEREEKGEGKGRREGAGGRGSEEWDGGGSERGRSRSRSRSRLGVLGGSRRSGRGTPRAADPSFRGEGQAAGEGRRDSSVNQG